MRCTIRPSRADRRGAVAVITAIFCVILLGMVAFALDLGYIVAVRTELQRSADAAALAAAADLVPADLQVSNLNPTQWVANARNSAAAYAASNWVGMKSPAVDQNASNAPSGDVLVGYLDPGAPAEFDFTTLDQYNAVKVRVRRTTDQNGQVPFFFGRVFGLEGIDTWSTATALVTKNFGGFSAPGDGGNLDLLPFALDEDTWNWMMNGGGSDNWTWDSSDKAIHSGSDGVREVNLYPQGTGAPGNRGTVDIGSSNNSTADISRQILEGVSPADLDHHGGSLEFDDQGELFLNGDTGISAGVKDELAAIRGQPRIIPIFRAVHGPGNNAEYTIVKFAGIRIMAVKLTGSMSSKYVTIQPAKIKARGGVPGPATPLTSYYIYSAPRLVQ